MERTVTIVNRNFAQRFHNDTYSLLVVGSVVYIGGKHKGKVVGHTFQASSISSENDSRFNVNPKYLIQLEYSATIPSEQNGGHFPVVLVDPSAVFLYEGANEES